MVQAQPAIPPAPEQAKTVREEFMTSKNYKTFFDKYVTGWEKAPADVKYHLASAMRH